MPDSARLAVQLSNVGARLSSLLGAKLDYEKTRLAALASRRSLTDPSFMLDMRRTALLMSEERLGNVWSSRLRAARSRFATALASLDAMNPLAVLSRGYAAVHSEDGKKVITDVGGLTPGDRIRLSMRDGDVSATVDEVTEKKNG